MKTYITSDLHFGHTNIQKFCPKTRGHFHDVNHMNEEMIKQWNSIVSPEDQVFILGDVAFLPSKDAIAILRRLNGSKILIEGNHDRKLLNDPGFRKEFKEIHQYLRYIHDGQVICMFHFPILEWDQMHRGSLHFYGHLHGNKSGLEQFRARAASFDATGNVVTLIDDLIADALKGDIKGHHTNP